MTSVAVFIDWQNAYKSARTAFGLQAEPNERGNFSPHSLGRIIASANGRGADGELCRVEVHRGLPSNARDPVGYAACRRQSQAWMKENPEIIIPRLRPLRYPDGWPDVREGENGIDVQLALGIVEALLLDKCHVAVLISNDSDLKPVIETVTRLRGAACIETAAWDSPHGGSPRLRVSGAGVFHHKLDEEIFGRVEQTVNYAYKGPTS